LVRPSPLSGELGLAPVDDQLPARMIDRHLFDAFLGKVDCAELTAAGENLILDVARDELEFEDWDDGSGWLAALTPLRAEMLAGDLRILYLLWLTAVEADQIEADEPEPMPGIGPMTATLEAFAEFFNIDPDLVQAAESGGIGAQRHDLHLPDASPDPAGGTWQLPDLRNGVGTA
jgi:hypothetical protein